MANKKQPVVKLRISEDLLRRMLLVSKAQGQSLNNQMLLLCRNAVTYHERARGKLDTRALAELDISDYVEPQEDDAP